MNYPPFYTEACKACIYKIATDISRYGQTHCLILQCNRIIEVLNKAYDYPVVLLVQNSHLQFCLYTLTKLSLMVQNVPRHSSAELKKFSG